MRHQLFTTLSNVLLLSISLCITELMNQGYSNVFEEKKEQPKKIYIESDITNPIYIFK